MESSKFHFQWFDFTTWESNEIFLDITLFRLEDFFNEPHTPSGKQATRSLSLEKDAKEESKTQHPNAKILYSFLTFAFSAPFAVRLLILLFQLITTLTELEF
ncbi:hypothetical protein CDG76_10285 [Nostoc sp. 'Peltigera membranacea cyanobiont' 210A]|nr:hypothetical protein CDG76_10285 [Nostoc sp. 'Peltigera membranacea cyanobiont' 210A]